MSMLGLATSLTVGAAQASDGGWHGPTRMPAAPIEFEVLSLESDTHGYVHLMGHDDPFLAGIWVGEAESGPDFIRTLSLSADEPVTRGASYAEGSWAHVSPDAAAMAKVQWIVSLGSAPQRSVWTGGSGSFAAPLRTALSAAGLADSVVADLSASDLVVGVQAAIWHFTDGVALDAERSEPGVVALYEFLTGPANVGASEPPGLGWLEVSLTPEHLEGEVGSRVGPFTVSANVDLVRVGGSDRGGAAEPVPVFDADGVEVHEASDGAELYLDVSEAGASLFVDARRTFAGTVAVGSGPDLVILNYDEEVFLRSSVGVGAEGGDAEPSPAPSPGPSSSEPAAPAEAESETESGTLPATGPGSVAAMVTIGLALLAAGGLFHVTGRRRCASRTLA
jgi:LPXTG-motif cell wall-anchored protein